MRFAHQTAHDLVNDCLQGANSTTSCNTPWCFAPAYKSSPTTSRFPHYLSPLRKELRVSATPGSRRSSRSNKHCVGEMLRKHRGNVTRAAFEAGKDRRAFGRLVKKYSVDG